MLVDVKGLCRRERLPGIRELILDGVLPPPLEEQVPTPLGTAQSGHSSEYWGSPSLSNVGPGSAFRGHAFCDGEPRKRKDSGSSLAYSVDSQDSSHDSSTSGPNENRARRQPCSSNSSAALSGGDPRPLPARRQQVACSRTRPQSENRNNIHAKLKEAIDDANRNYTEKCKCTPPRDKARRTSVFCEGNQVMVGCSVCQTVYEIEDLPAFIHKHEERNRRNEHRDLYAVIQRYERVEMKPEDIGTPLTKQNKRSGKNGETSFQKTDLLRAVPKLVDMLYERIRNFAHQKAQLAEENSHLARENAHLRQLLGMGAGHATGYLSRPNAAPGTPVSDQSSQPPSPKRVKEDSSSSPEPRSPLKDRNGSWRKRR